MHPLHPLPMLVIIVCASFVSDLPQVLSMPLKLYLPKGMLGRIDCPINANPPTTQVVWIKNEQRIDFSRTSRMKRTNQGLLIISPVMKSDEGHYKCQPCSPMGCGQHSSVVKIIVRGQCVTSSYHP